MRNTGAQPVSKRELCGLCGLRGLGVKSLICLKSYINDYALKNRFCSGRAEVPQMLARATEFSYPHATNCVNIKRYMESPNSMSVNLVPIFL
jgi:hypothetical protein